jgi:hypothetical protein
MMIRSWRGFTVAADFANRANLICSARTKIANFCLSFVALTVRMPRNYGKGAVYGSFCVALDVLPQRCFKETINWCESYGASPAFYHIRCCFHLLADTANWNANVIQDGSHSFPKMWRNTRIMKGRSGEQDGTTNYNGPWPFEGVTGCDRWIGMDSWRNMRL